MTPLGSLRSSPKLKAMKATLDKTKPIARLRANRR